jgi:hypothetical protein
MNDSQSISHIFTDEIKKQSVKSFHPCQSVMLTRRKEKKQPKIL